MLEVDEAEEDPDHVTNLNLIIMILLEICYRTLHQVQVQPRILSPQGVLEEFQHLLLLNFMSLGRACLRVLFDYLSEFVCQPQSLIHL
jgi:hypothetical protein